MTTPPTTDLAQQPKPVTVLGSTGSIGTQTLEIISAFPQRFTLMGLSAGNNLNLLAEQINKFKPQQVCIQSHHRVDELRQLVPNYKGDILSGPEGLEELATNNNYETLVVGLVGIIGLAPTLKALEAGKQVLTANKETFVAGGHLVKPYLNQIIPLDSEHCAIHQCLKNEPIHHVDKLFLTASGGPFRTLPINEMKNITKAQALKHPNWTMGNKVTIDSATLMNKGLEVIEAHWLFGVAYDDIQIVIHPQSMIHSGVGFKDGSVLTQLGQPDMRVPIQYGLFYPERTYTPFESAKLNLIELGQLDFEAPDPNRFPCYELAYEAGRSGPNATIALNAADEIAVEAFLNDAIGYTDIFKVLEQTVASFMDQITPTPSLPEIKALDAAARTKACEIIGQPKDKLLTKFK